MKSLNNLFILVLLIAVSIVSSAEDKKLSKQSARLKDAMKNIDSDQGRSFSKWFPKDKTEFNRVCNSSKFDELYDCHGIIQDGAKKVIQSFPRVLGPKIALITSELNFDADAPNYLQGVWVEFCTTNP